VSEAGMPSPVFKETPVSKWGCDPLFVTPAVLFIRTVTSSLRPCAEVRGVYFLWGRPLRFASLTGIVVGKVVKSHYVVLTLDDGTGAIGVSFYNDGGPTAQDCSAASLGDFVTATGPIREFRGRTELRGRNFVRHADPDCIALHMLRTVRMELSYRLRATAPVSEDAAQLNKDVF